ncbi:TonB-dependent receptor plug domain-containing protein [Acanthopleuribacter pedis]|uniref:TonB-dependent receptor n=1 Tax=Acanthopleuribacter pedis TaxID=442870 RepID=A0A8J7QBW4_9BACT|nr:TonB-dependent receptor [Acanthopleuribacter pedis]MBO1322786.1 TonB-dependent receptor [Acanthopleuribacter pedis]
MGILTDSKAVRGLARLSALVAMAFSFTAVSFAQDNDKDPEKIEPVEERITVTGTRIKRTDAETAAPIDVVTREEIEKSGATSIDRILQELPSVTGGALNTNISNGNDDRSTITIRGLDSSNTLVLLNGRRLVNHGRASASVDLNTIPLQAVERIEVLKDGGSAIYGSDAVAGVVNIITRDHVDGFETPLYYGQTSRGDLETQNYSVLFGTSTDRARIMVSANYYEKTGIFSRDRSISNDADTSQTFGIDLGYFNRSSATPTGYFNVPGLGVMTLDPALGDGSDASHFRAFDNTVDRYNFREETPATLPQERSNIFMTGSYDWKDNISFFAEAWYMKIKTDNGLAPNPLFTAFNGFGPITVSADNQYNPFGVDIPDVRRRMIETGLRSAEREGDNYRVVGGVEGSFGTDWSWDAYFLWHEDTRRNFQAGALIGPRVELALGPADQCLASPGCVQLNLFGGPGSITEEMLDYVSTTGLFTGRSNMKQLAFNIAGTLAFLPAGGLGFAAGVEYREEFGEDNPDSLVSLGETIGFTNFERTFGDRDLKEAYAELYVPIANSVPGAQLLEMTFAGRYSDYSDFGDNFAPKFGFKYKPIEQVALRATYSETFKAPTLNQLFSGNSQGFPTLVDPLAPAGETRTQFLTVEGSNPDLSPESSEVTTVGLVVEPVENLSFTIDRFVIDQEDVVKANAQYILDENANSGAFAERVIRDADGFLQLLISTPINVGRVEVSGWDFNINYRMPDVLDGLSVTLNGTYMDKWDEQATPDTAFIERAGTFDGNDGPGSVPDYKINMLWSLNSGKLNVSGGMNYISTYEEVEPFSGNIREIDSWLTVDVQAGYAINPDFRISVGIDNILDEEPPFSAQAFNDNFDGSTHNLYGTFFYTQITNRF